MYRSCGLSPAPRDWETPSTRTLGHDSEDGVVAADAGAILLVVLLGVAHLKELGLGEAAVRSGTDTFRKGTGLVNRHAKETPVVRFLPSEA